MALMITHISSDHNLCFIAYCPFSLSFFVFGLSLLSLLSCLFPNKPAVCKAGWLRELDVVELVRDTW